MRAGKVEMCRAGGQAGNSWAAVVHRQNFFREMSVLPLRPFNSWDETWPILLRIISFTYNHNCKCSPHLQNTFTETLEIVFNWITGYCSPAKLMHETDHHSRFLEVLSLYYSLLSYFHPPSSSLSLPPPYIHFSGFFENNLKITHPFFPKMFSVFSIK